MIQIKKFEAMETECQTPDAVYNIKINDKSVLCNVELPFPIELSEEEAKQLESNIHNAMELVLSKYFNKR